MTIKLSLLAAMLAVASLGACGGGSSTEPSDQFWNAHPYTGPTVLTKTDLVLGSGAEAVAGKSVTVKLTQWNYSALAPEFKGDPYTAGVAPTPYTGGPAPAPYTFTLAITSEPNLADALLGMKAGGRRSAVIPGDMSPGEWSSRLASAKWIRPAQVAEIELISVN
jgi:FKBP-type peptidyl-prolyl cis-trans isomerase FkpA